MHNKKKSPNNKRLYKIEEKKKIKINFTFYFVIK